MPKFYFKTENSEMCYTLAYHLAKAKDEGLTKIELFEGVPIKDSSFFWCKKFEALCEHGCCDKMCEGYDPCNGKSGKCRFKQNTMFEAVKKVKFEVK